MVCHHLSAGVIRIEAHPYIHSLPIYSLIVFSELPCRNGSEHSEGLFVTPRRNGRGLIAEAPSTSHSAEAGRPRTCQTTPAPAIRSAQDS